MKSILMIGQSNMAGRGFINEVPMICNERILMLRNAGWQMMAEPINYDRPNAESGLRFLCCDVVYGAWRENRRADSRCGRGSSLVIGQWTKICSRMQ